MKTKRTFLHVFLVVITCIAVSCEKEVFEQITDKTSSIENEVATRSTGFSVSVGTLGQTLSVSWSNPFGDASSVNTISVRNLSSGSSKSYSIFDSAGSGSKTVEALGYANFLVTLSNFWHSVSETILVTPTGSSTGYVGKGCKHNFNTFHKEMPNMMILNGYRGTRATFQLWKSDTYILNIVKISPGQDSSGFLRLYPYEGTAGTYSEYTIPASIFDSGDYGYRSGIYEIRIYSTECNCFGPGGSYGGSNICDNYLYCTINISGNEDTYNLRFQEAKPKKK